MVDGESIRPGLRGLLLLLLSSLSAALLWGVSALPREATGLQETVFGRLDASGVDNPVTAVLLDFRAWDTLLEIAVLMLALFAIWSLMEGVGAGMVEPHGHMLSGVVPLLVPLMLLVGGYLLWAGADQPGGAFQAGAVMSAAGILLLLIDRPALGLRPLVLRWGIVIGLGVFIGVGIAGFLMESDFLSHPQGFEKAAIIAIELASTVSIALILIGVFAAGPGGVTRAEPGGEGR